MKHRLFRHGVRSGSALFIAAITALGLAGALASAANAQGKPDAPATAPAAAPQPLSPQKQAQLQSLSQQAAELTKTEDWDKALVVFDKIGALLPNNPSVDYDRASCQARLGNNKEALADLARAVDEGFGLPDHILNDINLTGLHDDPQFNALVAKARKIPLADLPPEVKQQRAQQDYATMGQQMQNKDWPAAMTTSDELLILVPKDSNALYNRACIQARLGKSKEAMQTLDESIEAGYVDYDHIKVDDDLQTLHDDPEFAKLVAKAEKTEDDYTRFPVERGDDIPDVKTVEDYVQGGMRYRLRMGKDATAAHPDRLVVWLHPSGGSMDNIVEALSPELVKHHLALLVFPQKGYLNWSPTDVEHMNKTLDAVSKIPGINGDRALAIGFSAGGQMLLQLYNQDPHEFGGLVLDSAYPIVMTDATHGHVQVPPKVASVKDTPILAVVGGADKNGKIWDAAEPAWKSAGVPLTLVTVPNGVHQWLFGSPEQEKMLVDWLSEVNAGKLPGKPTTMPDTQE